MLLLVCKPSCQSSYVTKIQTNKHFKRKTTSPYSSCYLLNWRLQTLGLQHGLLPASLPCQKRHAASDASGKFA